MLRNPDKFRFCQTEVNWSGFMIGKDLVQSMPHLTNAIRNFPLPVNKTDLRSLLKEGTPWEWTNSISQTFTATWEILANRVEEGIKVFDPYKVTLLTSD